MCLRWFYMSEEVVPSWLYDNPVLDAALAFMGPHPTVVNVIGDAVAGAVLGISAMSATKTNKTGIPTLLLGALTSLAAAMGTAIYSTAYQLAATVTERASGPAATASSSILPQLERDVTAPVGWMLLAGFALWLFALVGEVRDWIADRRIESRRQARIEKAEADA